MFKRLCALNDAEAKECKVCLNRIEAAGRYEFPCCYLLPCMVLAALLWIQRLWRGIHFVICSDVYGWIMRGYHLRSSRISMHQIGGVLKLRRALSLLYFILSEHAGLGQRYGLALFGLRRVDLRFE
jgi:hypothetical protein